MEAFLTKHRQLINASLSCFDRLIFKGYLPLGYESAMEGFLSRHGMLLKDFGRFVQKQAGLLQAHARAVAEETGPPLIHLNARRDKEKLVGKLLEENPVSEGLICILSAVEAGSSFRVAPAWSVPRASACATTSTTWTPSSVASTSGCKRGSR